MKKLLLTVLTISLSTGLLCEKAYSFDHSNISNCVNMLGGLVKDADYHKEMDNGAKYFIGKYKGKDGVIFQDKQGNFRFVSKDNVGKPKSIKLNKNEIYSVGLQDDKLVMKSGKSNHPPILSITIEKDNDFFESLRVLINQYGENVISELKAKKDSGKQELGAKEYKAFSTCEKLGKGTSSSISDTSFKYMHKLPSYTVLNFAAIDNVKNRKKRKKSARRSGGSSSSTSAE